MCKRSLVSKIIKGSLKICLNLVCHLLSPSLPAEHLSTYVNSILATMNSNFVDEQESTYFAFSNMYVIYFVPKLFIKFSNAGGTRKDTTFCQHAG